MALLHEDEIDASNTEEITCPYCGHEDSDSWEAHIDESDEERECKNEDCGRKFTVCKSVSVKYSSRKMDCAEGEHRYRPVESWHNTQEDVDRYKRTGDFMAKYITKPETTWRRKCALCEDQEHEKVELGAACPERLLALPAAE